MKIARTFSKRFREAIHYVSSSLRAKKWNFLQENPFKFTTFVAIPFGVTLFTYTYYKVIRNKQMKIS